MASSVKGMLSEANASVPKVSADEARKMVAEQNALLVDVRDAPELKASGKIPGSINISRGMLEFRADPDTPYYNAEFAKDRPVVLYCASGGRSALSGQRLKEMGYEKVYNLGGFKDYVEGGGEIEQVE